MIGGSDSLHLMSDDDCGHALNCADVFYDTHLFASSDLDDTDLLSSLAVSGDMEFLSTSEPMTRPGLDLLEDCEPLVNGGRTQLMAEDNGQMLEMQTLEILSQAGIQQPAERQIRLHSELVHHLSSSPDSQPDCMPVKSQTAVSSDSELVRMLTSALEDAGSVTQLLPQRDTLQHVGVMPVSSADWLSCQSQTDVKADSELVRQLSLSTDDLRVASSNASVQQQQQQCGQRVALVQPTLARPRPRPMHAAHHTSEIETSQLIVDEPHVTVTRQLVPQSTVSADCTIQQITQAAVSAQPAPRQIILTTQAPLQAQCVPQISLQQLQQVIHVSFTLILCRTVYNHCIVVRPRGCACICSHWRL